MFSHKKELTTDMHILLGTVGSLLIFGTIFIYSSSSVFALESYGSSHYFVKRQLIGLLVGLCAFIGVQCVSLETIQRMAPLLFLGSCALTALTLFPQFSLRVYGSNRWLRIAGFSFQPSELIKIGLILYVAHFLQKKSRYQTFLRGYLPLLIILMIPAVILLKQPDFGLTVTLFLTVFILLFVAQFHVRYLALTILCFIPTALILVLMHPYRVKRVLTFLDPWHDPQGAGFQIIQSLIAIGSGRAWGIGIAHSKQKFFYLPMQHTDFIFSIIAEETGFIGCLFLLFLLMLLLYTGIRIASRLENQFNMFTALGFTILISLQSVINIGVSTGLLPTKGIGLPFVSYGNTALVCNLIMVSLIIKMVREQNTHLQHALKYGKTR